MQDLKLMNIAQSKAVILQRFLLRSLSIFLSVVLPLSAGAETVREARARAEQYLLSPGGEVPRGPNLNCNSPRVFKFYKMAFADSVATPELCDAVTEYADHFSENILPYWPLKENFGFEVQPIANLEEFNASFNSRPTLNKMTLSYFNFRYLPGAPIPPQKVVWSHEAGHAALQEILDDHFFPVAREAFLTRIENQAQNGPAEKQLLNLKAQVQAIHDSWSKLSAEETAIMGKQQTALGFRIAALENTLQTKDPTNSLILGAFHEFFADLFAVYFYNNPNIIGESFDALGLKKTPSDFRRFDPKSAIVSAQGWSNLEPHVLLTPARHYFGKQIYSKIKNPKRFMNELAQYFIGVLENPDSSVFLDYNPIIGDVEGSSSPEELASAIASRQKTSEIFSWFRKEQIKDFCDVDFKVCKTEILKQLKRGQNGLFLTNVNAEGANMRLIEAMEKIAKKIN